MARPQPALSIQISLKVKTSLIEFFIESIRYTADSVR